MIMEDFEKKYKDALAKARKLATDLPNGRNDRLYHVWDLESIFSELNESEDEKIKKSLINYIKAYGDSGDFTKEEYIAWIEKQCEQKPVISYDALREGIARFGITQYQIDNWLKKYVDVEKQGEKKPADKVEPKFNLYDWVVTDKGDTVQIRAVNNGYYTIGNGMDFNTSYVDRCWNKWSIRDAKDCDVLIDKSGSRECPFIFKETKPSDIKTDILNPLSVLGYCGIGGAGFTKGSGWGDTANCIYYPATKEQRDQLEKTMADAGYTFDFEKKELKKVEQKSAWSEEDERMLNHIIGYIHSGDDFQTGIDWLKSLKERNAWKPSDEQMAALSDINCTGCISYAGQGQELVNLYNDLKKLREE